MSQCHRLICACVSLYKAAHCTNQGDPIHYAPHQSQTESNFLSLIQLDQNHNKLRNWWTWRTNPNRFRSNFKQIKWSFSYSSQRFNWIFITELECLQFKHWIHSQKPRIQCDHRNPKSWKEEEENEEFKDSEPVKKKRKELPVYSRIRTKNQWNRIRNSEFLKILAQISDWNPGKHENFILTHSKTTTNPGTM